MRASTQECTIFDSVEPCDVRLTVVVDGAGDQQRISGVAEPVEQLVQLVRGQQVEQHEHVGLLGDLVAVGGVALRLQDAVEPGDVAVALDVVDPVELLEPVVPLELAEDAVVVPAQPQLAADVLPAVQLAAVDVEQVEKLPPAPLRQQPHRGQRLVQRPGRP